MINLSGDSRTFLTNDHYLGWRRLDR
jgi:hypothetical protein